jgi:hypothetical protein
MSDDSARVEPTLWSSVDDLDRLAVAAHSLLGGVSAVRSALDVAISRRPEAHDYRPLMLAAQRLDRMAEELRDLALGLPDAHGAARRETLRSRTELAKGASIEVHSSFNDAWTPGFEIAETVIGGYRVRRASDHSVLPGLVASIDVREIAYPSAG